jgi:hypothetical protein
VGEPSFTILTGKLYIWAAGFDFLNLAQQLQCSDFAKEALERGRTVIRIGSGAMPIVGLSLGQGVKDEIVPVKLSIAEAGFPLFSCPIVCTTGRVPGLPGELGYFGDANSRRSRKWIFSMNLPLEFWRDLLRLPPIRGGRPAVFRITSTANKVATRSRIYREIKQGGV